MIDTLVVIGVGLIGGSFALDLRRQGRVRRVIGVGRTAANLERALQLGVIDAAMTDAAAAVTEADFVLLATPVGQMGARMAEIAPVLRPGTVVTDAGSTKADVASLYHEHLANHLPTCVPGHPIAGSDLSGAAAARYGLFDGRRVVLTPLKETDAVALGRVQDVWVACGAQVQIMSAKAHDRVFAAVSHLPHLLAFAYMNAVLARPDAGDCLALAAAGFRDFTRIAGSHPEMWRDIALANRHALVEDLAAFRRQLEVIEQALATGDGAALAATFEAASTARAAWGKAGA
jgi:prephenate dehydrogenase